MRVWDHGFLARREPKIVYLNDAAIGEVAIGLWKPAPGEVEMIHIGDAQQKDGAA